MSRRDPDAWVSGNQENDTIRLGLVVIDPSRPAKYAGTTSRQGLIDFFSPFSPTCWLSRLLSIKPAAVGGVIPSDSVPSKSFPPSFPTLSHRPDLDPFHAFTPLRIARLVTCAASLRCSRQHVPVFGSSPTNLVAGLAAAVAHASLGVQRDGRDPALQAHPRPNAFHPEAVL